MAAMTTIQDLLTAEIKDLYSAEKQLIKALPKMVSGANDPDLKAALKAHLEETKQQAERLIKVAEIMGVKATGKVCKGMEGVIEEGAEALSEDGEAIILDLSIISAASRVEHYEIAGYSSAISLAEALGHTEAVKLLNESLFEENGAEASLSELSARLISEHSDAEAPVDRVSGKMGEKMMAGKT